MVGGWRWHVDANEPGKVRRQAGCLSRFIDMSVFSQIRERQAGIERATVIGIFGKIAVDDEPPVEGNDVTDRAHHLDDGRRAVRRNGVVEFGRRRKRVGVQNGIVT